MSTSKPREIYWLIGKHSPLSLENRLLIYKTVLKPVWTYGIELWGCATKSNIAVIQRYQFKLLRTIINAPWHVSNQTLHSDLHIPHVRTVFRERTATHHTTLDSHPNPLMEPLVHPPNSRRLKRRWTFDEIHEGSVAGRLLDHRQLDSTLAHRKRRSDVLWLLIKVNKNKK
jgi:hypothetical protein